jgi:hypothetical protein
MAKLTHRLICIAVVLLVCGCGKAIRSYESELNQSLDLTSIVKQNSDTKDVYYKINLQLWNVPNGLLDWSEETEIRKSRS